MPNQSDLKSQTAGSSKRSSIRRGVNSLAMNGGEYQESKFFSTVGKCLCIWLVWKHAELLIDNWEALFVLLLFLIAPDLIKKFITMRFTGGQGGFSRVERKESSEVVTEKKPDKEFT